MRTGVTPRVTAETKGFWDGCAEGELRVQRCGGCGTPRFPPQPMCPVCRSTDRGWVPVAGKGRIYSFSIVTGEGSEPQLPGESGHPFAVATVELPEGVRMITDIDSAELDRLEVGASVEVVFEPLGEGIHLPRFHLS